MLKFDFLEKGLGTVSPPHSAYEEKCHTLLTDQILLPDCLYFLRYWSVCVLKLLLNQIVIT